MKITDDLIMKVSVAALIMFAFLFVIACRLSDQFTLTLLIHNNNKNNNIDTFRGGRCRTITVIDSRPVTIATFAGR